MYPHTVAYKGGLLYSILSTVHVVFGFFQDSFTDLEQESSYSVQTGYLKGAVNAGENLEFLVTATDGTASETQTT